MAATAVAPGMVHADFAQWERQFQPTGIYEIARQEADKQTRARAEQFMAQVALGATMEVADAPGRANMSLMEAVRRAREGDPEARRLVAMNVRTDFVERAIKAGHVMGVEQEISPSGEIVQHGQTDRDIQANSLRFGSKRPQMRQRTKAETRNMFRIQDALQWGLLEDSAILVVSRAADNMSLEDMADEGFFTDTMSTALQLITKRGNKLFIETAFVAGKKHRTAERHDAETVVRFGRLLKLNLAGLSATGLLDSPICIPLGMVPNGVIDAARWWDDAAGGTFFGQAKPRQDYMVYRQECRARERELEPMVQLVVNQLLAEGDAFHRPVDATRRLGELSEAALLKRAVTDSRIDSRVFGVPAASFLEAARYYYQQGNLALVGSFTQKALAVADSRSCPGGAAKAAGETEPADENSSERADDADCDYISKECPLCGAKNVRTVDRKIIGNRRRISGSCGCAKNYVKN